MKTFSGKTIVFYKEDITIKSTWYDLKLLIEKKINMKVNTKQYYLLFNGKRQCDNDKIFTTDTIPNRDYFIEIMSWLC